MYARAYNQLFWGLIFIIFNFNLGPINVLPNFIGYFLIAAGLGTLKKQHAIFQKGIAPAFVLGLINMSSSMYIGTGAVQNSQFMVSNLPALILGSIQMLGDIYIMYISCRGVYLVALDRGLDDFADTAKSNFYAYLIFASINTLFMPFLINCSRWIFPIMIIVLILYTICVLCVAGVFRRARVLLENNEENIDNSEEADYKIDVEEEEKADYKIDAEGEDELDKE